MFVKKKVTPKPWTPTVKLKHPDTIISSDYTTVKPFTPSYDRDRRPCIEQLLANEYQRIWWKEKNSWAKMYYSSAKSSKVLLRGVVRNRPKPQPADKVDDKKQLQKTTSKSKKDEIKREVEDKTEKQTTPRSEKEKKCEVKDKTDEKKEMPKSEKEIKCGVKDKTVTMCDNETCDCEN